MSDSDLESVFGLVAVQNSLLRHAIAKSVSHVFALLANMRSTKFDLAVICDALAQILFTHFPKILDWTIES